MVRQNTTAATMAIYAMAAPSEIFLFKQNGLLAADLCGVGGMLCSSIAQVAAKKKKQRVKGGGKRRFLGVWLLNGGWYRLGDVETATL